MNEQNPGQAAARAQIAALLELLPTLKAELRFAGCEQGAPLFRRIEQMLSELNQAQRSAMDSRFASTAEIEDPVAHLQQYPFLAPVYHCDGHGHVQVQQPQSHQPHSLESLLQAIEDKNDWSRCFCMFEAQDPVWLAELAEQLTNSAAYHTQCQLKLSELLNQRAQLIGLLQDADQWYWDAENHHLLLSLMATIESLLVDDDSDELEQEIERSMLNALKQRLAERYQQLVD
ncbi:hypothetical protein [Agarivorans sp. Z349TD_8]|uniref:hypothetical protein n=1 Tax=Agarivorans sp. Z349TD_8 TaxID=3421434 RepID=UPI003D7CC140